MINNYLFSIQLCIFFLFFSVILPGTAFAQLEFHTESERQRIEMARDLEENWTERVQEINELLSQQTIHGRVLDQNNEPVVGAQVKLQWNYFDLKEFWGIHVETRYVSTNANGYFNHTVNQGFELSLFGVSKSGYEFKSETGGDYYQDYADEEAMIANSINEPIIIYMRKLNPTTFLLKSEVSRRLEESVTLRYTMIPGLLIPIKPDLSNLKKPEQHDLIFTVTRNEDNSYILHIRPIPDVGGSMQLLDDYMYEAPAEGYASDLTIIARPEEEKIHKYLYFTSRNPPVYSRMEIRTKVRSDGKLSFKGSTWTNPYGKRNLEWEPELPFDLEEKLEKEAENALNSGSLPTEPSDLQQLIDQYRTD